MFNFDIGIGYQESTEYAVRYWCISIHIQCEANKLDVEILYHSFVPTFFITNYLNYSPYQ